MTWFYFRCFCRKLTFLFLQDLPEVRNKTKCCSMLQEALPSCNIDYKDLTHSPTWFLLFLNCTVTVIYISLRVCMCTWWIHNCWMRFHFVGLFAVFWTPYKVKKNRWWGQVNGAMLYLMLQRIYLETNYIWLTRTTTFYVSEYNSWLLSLWSRTSETWNHHPCTPTYSHFRTCLPFRP